MRDNGQPKGNFILTIIENVCRVDIGLYSIQFLYGLQESKEIYIPYFLLTAILLIEKNRGDFVVREFNLFEHNFKAQDRNLVRRVNITKMNTKNRQKT